MNVEKYLKIIAKDNSEFSLFKNKIFPVTMAWEGGGRLHHHNIYLQQVMQMLWNFQQQIHKILIITKI